MTKKTRRSLLLLAAGGVILAGGTFAQPRSAAQPEQAQARPRTLQVTRSAAETPDDVTVLVEAFVVEASLPALYDLGVSPLGEASKQVSVEQLLTCLKKGESASVLLGVRTAGVDRSRGNATKETETTYRPKTRVVSTQQGQQTEHVDYTAYENGQSLTVQPTVRDNGVIELEYSFSYSGVRANAQNAEAPPNVVSWSWAGNVSLPGAAPAIVGSTQDQDSAVFLVFAAHVLE